MNQFNKIDSSKKISIIFMMFLFVLLSNGAAFGQTAVENKSDFNTTITTNTSETIVVKQEDTETNSNMNFVLWFMGSKQDPNMKISTEGFNTKKEFMTSGMAPNRLLIKAFLKKAVTFETAIA